MVPREPIVNVFFCNNVNAEEHKHNTIERLAHDYRFKGLHRNEDSGLTILYTNSLMKPF